jgi:O-antigen/teichoic acid export membrane protein
VSAAFRSGGTRVGLLILTTSMVGHLGNYLFYVLAARALSPAQFADVSAMTALATITFMPASGVQAAVARDTASLIASGRPGDADGLTRSVARALGLVQAALLLVLVLATPAAVAFLDLSSDAVWWTGTAWLVLGLALQVGLGPLQGRQRFGAVGAVLAGPLGALRPLLLVPGVALAGVTGALGALVLATVVGLVGVGWVLRRSFLDRASPRVRLTGALPAIAALVGIAALTNADVLAAKTLLPPTAAGLYASAALLGKIALYAPSALALVLLPKVTARLASGQDVRTPALVTMGATVATGGLVALAILLAPPESVGLVFGPEYIDAYALAAPLAAVMTLCALLQVHLMMALATREWATLWTAAGAAVLQLLGLALLAESAVDVVVVTAVATAAAVLVHEVLSPFGAVRLLSRKPE